MKHLPQYIIEGIFDIEDNIKSTEVLDKQLIEDKDSDFWKFIHATCAQSMWLQKEAEINLDKKTLYTAEVGLDGSKNPLTCKYELTCDRLYIGNPSSIGPHPDPIKDGAGFSSITVKNNRTGNGAKIDGLCKEIEGLKLYVYGEAGGNNYGQVAISFGYDLKFKDSSITFMTKMGMLIYNGLIDFPDFGGLKSNADIISFYDASLYDHDGVKNKLNKFFGNGTFTTSKGDEKKTNIRNIVATANNKDKYGSIDPDSLVPVGKVSDLFDLKGLKEVEEIRMSNNNVEITFYKDDAQLDSFAKYTRLQGLSKYKGYTLDQMKELCAKCKTADGWYVKVMKKYL